VTRWHVACDTCESAAWIGGAGGERTAWCEACQEAFALPDGAAPSAATSCPRCGRALTTSAPRFEEIYGELQNLAAVLAAWDGDPEPLAELLPERPRFLTDLTPEAPSPDDSSEARDALEALAAGAYHDARAKLEALDRTVTNARIARSLAIASERMGDPAAAEAALDRALALTDTPRLRLQRGALRARRGDVDAAREDLARAGDGFEARWDRAALTLFEAVGVTPGLPARELIDTARQEAGEPSSYWSDHTIGRLLWSLLAGRAKSRSSLDLSPCPDARTLRAAELELEFDTFWDRAMVLEGYARLSLAADAARIAAPLALELARQLAAEPSLASDAAGGIATVFDAAVHAISEGRPGEACDAILGLLKRTDLQHYRVPCRRCGRGSIGVDQIEEREEDAGSEIPHELHSTRDDRSP
jgi:tetratricopeptide (TPR) repeat protein